MVSRIEAYGGQHISQTVLAKNNLLVEAASAESLIIAVLHIINVVVNTTGFPWIRNMALLELMME